VQCKGICLLPEPDELPAVTTDAMSCPKSLVAALESKIGDDKRALL
jgi:hypothetical protein